MRRSLGFGLGRHRRRRIFGFARRFLFGFAGSAAATPNLATNSLLTTSVFLNPGGVGFGIGVLSSSYYPGMGPLNIAETLRGDSIRT